MGVNHKQQPSTTMTSGTSVGLTKPTLTSLNDIILVVLRKQNANAVSLPSGFTEVLSQSLGTTHVHMFWKRATASEPSIYTFSWSGSSSIIATISIWSGATTTGDPFESIQFLDDTGAADTSRNFPALTITDWPVVDAVLLGTTSDSVAITDPANPDEFQIDNDQDELCVASARRLPGTYAAGSLASDLTLSGYAIRLGFRGEGYGSPPPWLSAIRGMTSNSSQGASVPTITSPAETEVGDLLLTFDVRVASSTSAETLHSDFTSHGFVDGDLFSTRTAYRVATVAGAQSYQLNTGSTSLAAWAAVMVVLKKGRFNVSDLRGSAAYSTGGISFADPGAIILTDNNLLLMGALAGDSSQLTSHDFQDPAGYGELIEAFLTRTASEAEISVAAKAGAYPPSGSHSFTSTRYTHTGSSVTDTATMVIAVPILEEASAASAMQVI